VGVTVGITVEDDGAIDGLNEGQVGLNEDGDLVGLIEDDATASAHCPHDDAPDDTRVPVIEL